MFQKMIEDLQSSIERSTTKVVIQFDILEQAIQVMKELTVASAYIDLSSIIMVLLALLLIKKGSVPTSVDSEGGAGQSTVLLPFTLSYYSWFLACKLP